MLIPLDLIEEAANALHGEGGFFLHNYTSDYTRQKGKDIQARADELLKWVEEQRKWVQEQRKEESK